MGVLRVVEGGWVAIRCYDVRDEIRKTRITIWQQPVKDR